MEKEIEINVLKVMNFFPNTEQYVIFNIEKNSTVLFEAFSEKNVFKEGETEKICLSLMEWANYPKLTKKTKISNKFIKKTPMAGNEYYIKGKVLESDSNSALIDAGNELVFSIPNVPKRKNILKMGKFIETRGRLDITKK